MEPLWDRAYAMEQEKETVYELPLSNSEKIFQGAYTEGKPEEAQRKNNIRLIMTEANADGAYRSFYMSVISDGEATDLTSLHYKSVNDFSGKILFYTLKGEFINGWHYSTGKIDGSISPSSKSAYDENRLQKLKAGNEHVNSKGGKISSLWWPGDCEQQLVPTYGVSCVTVVTSVNCQLYQNGSTYVTVCSGSDGGNNDDGGVGNPPGGSGTPQPTYDCAGVMNGSAVRSDCGCIGGTTGKTECSTEVKVTDSLRTNYPCLQKLIFNKLNADTGFRKLLFPFTSNFTVLPDVKYTYANLPYGTTNTNYLLGATSYNTWDATIRLNSNLLSNGSQLFIAMTILHETAHAYTNYYLVTNSYGYPANDATWAMKIATYDKLRQDREDNSNFFDHSQFLESYFDQMVQVLSTYGGTSYTLQEYRMAILYGLDNAGDTPTNPNDLFVHNLLKSALMKSFDNIKAKYGITSAMLNTFYANNLINTPIEQKLPTTCL